MASKWIKLPKLLPGDIIHAWRWKHCKDPVVFIDDMSPAGGVVVATRFGGTYTYGVWWSISFLDRRDGKLLTWEAHAEETFRVSR